MILFDVFLKIKACIFWLLYYSFLFQPVLKQQRLDAMPDTSNLRVGMAGNSPFIKSITNEWLGEDEK